VHITVSGPLVIGVLPILAGKVSLRKNKRKPLSQKKEMKYYFKSHQPGEVTSHEEFLCYPDQSSKHFCNIL
jgi:hypothetical protein